MDLVRELKDVRFELSLRGYDCEAVDAFLAKLRGDITAVQEENESAVARIRELEQAVQDGGGASAETEGTLRRTLVLAQRLADETEAEAKKDAAEMLHAATVETEQMRRAAEVESQSMKEEGKRELSNARDEASTIRETVAEEAARTRADARLESEAILKEAERRGLERVATLEQTAQVESAAMREPIRQEVVELEGARARVMSDIAALESHLEQQRVRVRTAVEALRVGMSGSIEDLERVADDDDLLATHPAPEISGARVADVEVAPEIEIVDSVTMNAPLAPTVDDIEHGARAAIAAEFDDVESIADTAPSAEASVDDVPAEELVVDVPVEELTVDDVPVEDEVTDIVDVESVDLGPATEPIPIVDVLPVDPLPIDPLPVDEVIAVDEAADIEGGVDELDAAPTVLFGTDLAGEAEVEAVETATETATETVGDPSPVPVEADVSDAPAAASGVSFVERFAELLDAQAIGREQ